jgi:hypothetical protein
MKTIKIKNHDHEYAFVYYGDECRTMYYLYQDGNLIYKAVDTGEGIDLNGKLFEYHEFSEMYLFFRAIKKTDDKLMNDYVAVTETELFDL